LAGVHHQPIRALFFAMKISIHALFRAAALTDGKVGVKHVRAKQVQRAHNNFRSPDAGGKFKTGPVAVGSSADRSRAHNR
jgi:hypothetical protein